MSPQISTTDYYIDPSHFYPWFKGYKQRKIYHIQWLSFWVVQFPQCYEWQPIFHPTWRIWGNHRTWLGSKSCCLRTMCKHTNPGIQVSLQSPVSDLQSPGIALFIHMHKNFISSIEYAFNEFVHNTLYSSRLLTADVFLKTCFRLVHWWKLCFIIFTNSG